MGRCFEEVNPWTHDDKFLLSRIKLGWGSEGFNSSESTYIFQVEVNAEKLTRIRFNSDVPVIFKAPHIHEHDTLVLPETLMIEGGKVSWLHSLEELFILQNIADQI